MRVYGKMKTQALWTQRAWARHKDGTPANGADTEVVSRCLMCWVSHCYPDDVEYNAAIAKLKEVIGKDDLLLWNDDPDRTFKEVRAVLKKAKI